MTSKCIFCIICVFFKAIANPGSPVEMFSVRGDGLTTITTGEVNVGALVAQSSNVNYSGVVLESKTTAASGGPGFLLFKLNWVLQRSWEEYIAILIYRNTSRNVE